MSVPNFSEMVKRDLADLQRLRDRVLPIKVLTILNTLLNMNHRLRIIPCTGRYPRTPNW